MSTNIHRQSFYLSQKPREKRFRTKRELKENVDNVITDIIYGWDQRGSTVAECLPHRLDPEFGSQHKGINSILEK